METLMTNPVVMVALTFIVYAFAVKLGAALRLSLFNPILITIVVLMAVVQLTGTGYSGYASGGDLISFWLKPAVVALGVPLYRQLQSIRRQALFVIMAELAGFRVMRLTGVTSPVAQGLSMGTAAHAVGTSMAITEGGLRYGAWGSVGLTLNGLLTALLTPTLLQLTGIV